LEGQIRVEGNFETKMELVCARCLEPVAEEVSSSFDLFYAPLPKGANLVKHREDRLKDDDTDIGFYEGDGRFLADVLKEQVLLALRIEAICQSGCRGVGPNCGANLAQEACGGETPAMDSGLAA